MIALDGFWRFAPALLFLLGGLGERVELAHFHHLLVWPWLIGSSILGVLLLCAGFYKRFWLLWAFLILGFCWTGIAAHRVLDWHLPEELVGKTVIASGKIVSLPRHQQQWHRQSFVFALHALNQKPLKHPVLVQLSVYGGTHALGAFYMGDGWQFELRLRPVSLEDKRGLWFFQKHIRAKGYIVHNQHHQLNQRLSSSHGWRMGRLRQQIAEKMRLALKGRQLGGVIVSLAVGDRQDITQDQWQVLRRTGTAHLVAISGLHIGLVAGLFFWLGFQLFRYMPVLPVYLPAQQCAGLLSLLLSIFYSALAGFAVSTERALLMMGMVIVLQQVRYVTDVKSVFLTTLMLVLLMDPLVVFSMSFWLSFWAVAVILFALGVMPAWVKRWWQQILWIQGVLVLGMLPLNILFFGQVSLVSFLANLVAIPYVSFVVITLTLLSSVLIFINFSCGAWLLLLAERALACLWVVLQWFSDLPMAVWSIGG